MHRTVDDYDSMAKREIIKAKQEKAQMYVFFPSISLVIFLTNCDIADNLQARTKIQNRLFWATHPIWGVEERSWCTSEFPLKPPLPSPTYHYTPKYFPLPQRANIQRADLLSTSTSIPLTPGTRQRFNQYPPHQQPSPSTTPDYSESPYQSMSRQNYALHEHSFIQQTESRLDEFLSQGREVLDNLVDQRTMLKGTQRRLLDSANTLGLSRDVIGWIERRRWALKMLWLNGLC